MLIRAIRATNFMKFASLRLEDLPAEGLIAIEGPNESGKTSIGEAVLFAFFGKTRASSRLGLDRLIRWEADQMSVEVAFDVDGRGEYLIYREIDRSGTNYVKLIDRNTRVDIATGNVRVGEKLDALLHFGFEEALDSFFLHQLETGGGVKPRSQFLRSMSGIDRIDTAVEGFEKEIEQHEREYLQFQKDLQRNNRKLARIDDSLARLETLRQSEAKLDGELSEKESLQAKQKRDLDTLRKTVKDFERDASSLKQAADAPVAGLADRLAKIDAKYDRIAGAPGDLAASLEEKGKGIGAQRKQLGELNAFCQQFDELVDVVKEEQGRLSSLVEAETGGSLVHEKEAALDRLRRHRRSCRLAGLFAGVFLLLASVFGALCVLLLLHLPGHETFKEQLLSVEVDVEKGTAVLGLVCGISLVFSLVFLARRVSQAGRRGELREEIRSLERRIDSVIADQEVVRQLLDSQEASDAASFVARAGKLASREVGERVQSFKQRFEKLYGSGDGLANRLRQLAKSERALRSRAIDVVKRLESETRDVDKETRRLRSERDRARNEIREIEGQGDRKGPLIERGEQFESRARSVREEIDVRRAAIELLQETSRSILTTIGPSLSRFVRRMLPRLTDGRYRDVKVDEDLAVKVFTGDKCDFLDSAELSGGTIEGLELTMRLAALQALVQIRSKQPQFVFLDEPFKMMDVARAIEALSVLRELSPDIRQYFISRPDFTAAQRDLFDVVIRVTPSDTELALSGERSKGGPEGEALRHSRAGATPPPASPGEGAREAHAESDSDSASHGDEHASDRVSNYQSR